MSKNCGNERMAMIMQYVAIGSMIIMAGVAASQVLRDAFGPTGDTGAEAGRGNHAPAGLQVATRSHRRQTPRPRRDQEAGRRHTPDYAEETALVGPAHTLST